MGDTSAAILQFLSHIINENLPKMASSTRFSMSEADAPESPWQGPLDDSDFESLYDNRKGGRTASKMYWLGKKLLEQMLAMQVYSQNPTVETSDELDVMPSSHFPRACTDSRRGDPDGSLCKLSVS